MAVDRDRAAEDIQRRIRAGTELAGLGMADRAPGREDEAEDEERVHPRVLAVVDMAGREGEQQAAEQRRTLAGEIAEGQHEEKHGQRTGGGCGNAGGGGVWVDAMPDVLDDPGERRMVVDILRQDRPQVEAGKAERHGLVAPE